MVVKKRCDRCGMMRRELFFNGNSLICGKCRKAKHITISKKKLLCEFVNFKCESCKNIFEMKDLHIHRINRGYMGGTYDDFRNLKVLCKGCHKKIHAKEFT